MDPMWLELVHTSLGLAIVLFAAAIGLLALPWRAAELRASRAAFALLPVLAADLGRAAVRRLRRAPALAEPSEGWDPLGGAVVARS